MGRGLVGTRLAFQSSHRNTLPVLPRVAVALSRAVAGSDGRRHEIIPIIFDVVDPGHFDGFAFFNIEERARSSAHGFGLGTIPGDPVGDHAAVEEEVGLAI